MFYSDIWLIISFSSQGRENQYWILLYRWVQFTEMYWIKLEHISIFGRKLIEKSNRKTFAITKANLNVNLFWSQCEVQNNYFCLKKEENYSGQGIWNFASHSDNRGSFGISPHHNS